MIHSDKFIPFIGVVENINDPLEAGRVQVRVLGYHARNKGNNPTESLPWVSTGNYTACISGIGQSSNEYVNGSTVFGMMLNKDMQTGFIIMALSGLVGSKPISNEGFNDPDGVFPNYDEGESDINRLARGKGSTKTEYDPEEPKDKRNTVYPHNKVYETPNGIVIEYDDTPNHQRINIHHPSGSYIEMNPDGSIVTKSSSMVEIIKNDRTSVVRSNDNTTVDGNENKEVKGNINIKTTKANYDSDTSTTGTINTDSGYLISGEAGVSGEFTSADGKTIIVKQGIITFIG